MVTDRSARARADELFSLLVRARAGRCAVEDCPVAGGRNAQGLPVVGLETAHVISRRFSATRVDDDNAFCLCAEHHAHFTAHPFAWENWVIARIGRPAWDALRAKAHDPRARVDWAVEAVRLRGDLQRLVRAA